MVTALPRGGSSRADGAQPRRAPASQPDAGGARADGAGVAAGAHALGTAEAEAHSRAGRARTKLARGQQHRSAAAARRFGGATPEARAHRPVQRAAGACGRTQPRVVRGFQGLVPHRRRRAHRSANHLRRGQPVEKTDTARVQAIFEAAFREYGMPAAMRTDNGAPFATRALAGLSRLAVWWIKLDIVPERIAAGHPEQNGRHERM